MPDIFISSPQKPKTPKKDHSMEGHTHNPLAAYCYYPDKVNFVTQDPTEKIVLLLRRHPVTNVPWIVIAVAMLLAPFVLTQFPLLSFLPGRFQFIAILIWYLLTTAFVFQEFLDWFFNVDIVTNQRVVDVDFVSLIYRKMTDADLDKIQDVTVEMGGVIRALLNYGNVVIQTAGEIPEIEFGAVPNPDKVAKILHELRSKLPISSL